MSKLVCLSLLALFVLASAAPNKSNNRIAETCHPETCLLPDCQCSSTSTPGGFSPEQTPQFVMLTYDDAVTISNIEYYRTALDNRKNKDGCPVAATYYISHEYTDYTLVHELYSKGHEISLHSISHSANTTYWKLASLEQLTQEFADERTLMSHFAKVPADDIKGIRMPFLQLSGEKSFQMLKQSGLLFDSSWPSQSFLNPGMWPYTLNYRSTQDCPIGPCPVESWPGVWVLPMLTWKDNRGVVCAMVDTCVNIPDTVDGLVEFMIENFNRNYKSNRAPMGFYVHAAWFNVHENHFPAYVKFIDYLTSLDDVFMVGASDVIKWVQNPISVQDMINNENPTCRLPREPQCTPNTCPLKMGEETRYMASCQPQCPGVYPWLGNPLGAN